MPLESQLALSRCPHCSVDTPNLQRMIGPFETQDFGETLLFGWAVYVCRRCGGPVLAGGREVRSGAPDSARLTLVFPAPQEADDAIPNPAREFLDQAIRSLSSPAGSVMLCASAVDAMLKAKEYTKGSLYARIDAAAEAHLITQEMATWAHEVRLDANDPRHVDTAAPLPDQERARKCVEFVKALGMFLFVLPARVERGRKGAT